MMPNMVYLEAKFKVRLIYLKYYFEKVEWPMVESEINAFPSKMHFKCQEFLLKVIFSKMGSWQ